MKVCRECNKEKELHDFYKHSAMADGYLNKCIECVKARVAKHRESNIERVREYDKKRSTFPHRVQSRKEYQKTDQGKKVRKKAMENYHKKYPMKYAAHLMTSNALRDGRLIAATNCSECNSDKRIQGHHDDYTKPFEVRWLCEPCHKKWHKFNKAIYE